jgi:hypothetical protein
MQRHVFCLMSASCCSFRGVKDPGTVFLRKIYWLSRDYSALYPRRQNYAWVPLWEPQIHKVSNEFQLSVNSRCFCHSYHNNHHNDHRRQKQLCIGSSSSGFWRSYFVKIMKICICVLKKTHCPQAASELYRPSDRRLSAKLVPTFCG